MSALRITMLAGGLAIILAGSAGAQPAETASVSSYPRMATFPDEDRVKVAQYLAKARGIAGDDLYSDFVIRCIVDPRLRQRLAAVQMNAVLEPAKVFDQLYFVGQNAVSAWALDTSEGIVLFDALNDVEEAREILVPAMQKLGLDPARLRYIVVTHAHGDHYGGADYLRETYGARVISSAEDWASMERARAGGQPLLGPPSSPPPPPRDVTVQDGETLTLGTQALRFYVTPGHTAGTVSTIFSVTDGGERHVVAFFGGLGAPRDPLQRYVHIASMKRFAALAAEAGADAMLANHPLQDGAFEKMELLRYRQPGAPNPFVIGSDRIARYYQLQQTCSQVGLIRAGLDPERAPQ